MLLKSNVVAKHFAISVPPHDLSHYFWSVLLQALFFTDNLTFSEPGIDPDLPARSRNLY